MGIDKHELEHRNWRSSSTVVKKEIEREIAEQLDTSIVPSDNKDALLNPPNENAKTV
jgi:hypothetical protein